MMKLLIDTNVIIDYLSDRLPFADYMVKPLQTMIIAPRNPLLRESQA